MGPSALFQKLESFLIRILLLATAFHFQLGISEINTLDIPDIVEYGVCPLPSTEYLDMEKFSGVWYQVEEVPNQYMDVKQCIKNTYSYNGTSLLVTAEGLDKYGEFTDQIAVLSLVEPTRSSIPAHLQITAENVPNVPYDILKVNYSEYACVYSCFEVIELKVEIYSVLSRTPDPLEGSLEICRSVFSKFGLSLKKLRKVKQGDKCWYDKQGSIVFPAIASGIQTKGKGNETKYGLDVSLEDAGNELISVLEETGKEDEIQNGYKEILVGNDTLVQLNIKKFPHLSGDKEPDDSNGCKNHHHLSSPAVIFLTSMMAFGIILNDQVI